MVSTQFFFFCSAGSTLCAVAFIQGQQAQKLLIDENKSIWTWLQLSRRLIGLCPTVVCDAVSYCASLMGLINSPAVLNGQDVICSHLNGPHLSRSPFCFVYNAFLNPLWVFKVISVPSFLATQPAVSDWFAVSCLSNTVSFFFFFGKQRLFILSWGHFRCFVTSSYRPTCITVCHLYWNTRSKASVSSKESDKGRVSARCLPHDLIHFILILPFSFFYSVLLLVKSNLEKGKDELFCWKIYGHQTITILILKTSHGHLLDLERVCGLHYVLEGLFTSSVDRSILIKYTHTQTHSVLISCWEMLSSPTHLQTLAWIVTLITRHSNVNYTGA